MKNLAIEPAKPVNGNDSSHRAENLASEVAERIGRSIAYMMEHLHQPLQVATLAAQANFSLSHYFALFKQQTGMAPMIFFIHLRMNHARELLDSTHSSVKEIAGALGYDDPFYFSRVFKSVHRMAPSEYRRRNGQGKAVVQPANGRLIQPLALSRQPIKTDKDNNCGTRLRSELGLLRPPAHCWRPQV
jgi:transcriptional regulator GlxA family with amidase domain